MNTKPTSRRLRFLFAPVGPSILGLLAALQAAAQETGEPLEIPENVATALQARTPESVEDLRSIQSQVQRVVERGLPATVGVQVGRAAGSGVVISKEGLVLTVAHVIGRAGRRAWIVLPDGRRLRGRSLGANHNGDAGMVQLDDPPNDLPYAPLATQEKLELGEWVITTGQPGGVRRGRAPPVRLGRVLGNEGRYVRTDCALVGGDSGGPLFNMHGEVVGIHSSIGMAVTQNFHVPVSTFRDGWDRLLAGDVWGGEQEDDDEKRYYPVLGVAGGTKDQRCVISQVWPDMPAAAAGLKPGDVVTAVNGDAIDSFTRLSEIVQSQRPGRRIRLTIERDDEKVEIRVRLGGADRPLPGALDPPRPGGSRERGNPGRRPPETE